MFVSFQLAFQILFLCPLSHLAINLHWFLLFYLSMPKTYSQRRQLWCLETLALSMIPINSSFSRLSVCLLCKHSFKQIRPWALSSPKQISILSPSYSVILELLPHTPTCICLPNFITFLQKPLCHSFWESNAYHGKQHSGLVQNMSCGVRLTWAAVLTAQLHRWDAHRQDDVVWRIN